MRKIFEKLICVALIVLLMVGLVGCGQKKLSELTSVELWQIQEELFDCIGMSEAAIEERYPAYLESEEDGYSFAADSYPGWWEEDEMWVSKSSIEGIDVIYEFWFENGIVTDVVLCMEEYHNMNPQLLLEDYYYMDDLLLFEYGDPWREEGEGYGTEYKRGTYEMVLMEDMELWSEETNTIYCRDIIFSAENSWLKKDGEGYHNLMFWVSAW